MSKIESLSEGSDGWICQLCIKHVLTEWLGFSESASLTIASTVYACEYYTGGKLIVLEKLNGKHALEAADHISSETIPIHSHMKGFVARYMDAAVCATIPIRGSGKMRYILTVILKISLAATAGFYAGRTSVGDNK